MESQIPDNSEAQDEDETGAAKEGKTEKKEEDESSSGEYTYGSDDDDDDDDSDEEESPKGKQIEEKGEKTGGKFAEMKPTPPSDAEILARIQQKQVDEFYSCAEGSFLSDLAQLQDI